ncbi:vomeronasal 1 receptor ornAnaV1R3129 [Ornithorhynchus anatinus]|uniref:Vomeronasal type-1 receptor n=1 Tax=Ornithorhynchus anatinus TaxID=9258 RepID=F6XAY3_ORNAN|nr:vomeronasal 1 receptor ornAnaV1R3129 [Ornithorhynchus anatinus]
MFLNEQLMIIFVLSQAGIGLLGNLTLLMVYASIFFFQSNQKKTTDLILTHLIMTNTVILITQIFPGVVVTFGMMNFLGDVGCLIIMYIRRVARGLSICTTCLLSVFQAITISPSTSRWGQLKHRTPNYILPSLLFFWLLNMLIYINLVTKTMALKNVTITGSGYHVQSCSNVFRESYLNDITFIITMTFRDLFFLFLMSCTSGYMVMMLHQHRKRVQHIHTTNLSPKPSAESKATQSILLLVSCFVCFYCINSSITVYLNFMKKEDFQVYDIVAFLGGGYASLSPLVLISSDHRVRRAPCSLEEVRSLSLPRMGGYQSKSTSLGQVGPK